MFLPSSFYGENAMESISTIAEHATGTRQSTAKANTIVHTLYTRSHGLLGDG